MDHRARSPMAHTRSGPCGFGRNESHSGVCLARSLARSQSREDYAHDVRLVFTNAMAYNAQGHWVHDVARTLLAHFEQVPSTPSVSSLHTPVISPIYPGIATVIQG